MEKVDWLDVVENIGNINCAYYAMVSLLAWSSKELTDNERFGVFIINNNIFDSLKAALDNIGELRKKDKGGNMRISLDEFKDNAEDYIGKLGESTLILTHKGEDTFAVMDAARYQEQETLALRAILKLGEYQVKCGEFLNINDAVKEIKRKAKEDFD